MTITREQMIEWLNDRIERCGLATPNTLRHLTAIRDVIGNREPNLPPLSDKAGEAVRRIVD